jgi:hypothetical protein
LTALYGSPKDRNENTVRVGDIVRLISVSGKWLDELAPNEKDDVLSMIGEDFEIEEIDDYGHPCVTKAWSNESKDQYRSHSIALDPHEMELVRAKAL